MSGESHPLLALQAADTLADQLRHRREHLPEIEALDEAKRAVGEWERDRSALVARIDELQAVVDDAEARSAELDVKKSRLSAQLRTVIAPREAEALQAEMATIDEQRSDLDDVALAALEEQSELVDRIAEADRREGELRRRHTEAAQALDGARAAVDGESLSIADGRDALREAVDATLIARYDHLRRNQVVAAARLEGSRCTGCHLDLSAAELDDVRAIASGAADGVADCPHCGRMLVV